MDWLVISLSAVLLALAGLHVLWGIGLWVPLRDEAALAHAVVGARGRDTMPGALACSLVAVALLCAASTLWWPQGGLRMLALGAIATVFTLRGALAYTPAWRRMVPEQPFARLDQAIYGPFCLMIGAGFWAELAL